MLFFHMTDKTSMHPRYQDTEGKSDEREPLLTNIDQLGREGKQLITIPYHFAERAKQFQNHK